MPSVKKGEKRNHYVSRAIPILKGEGLTQRQAIGKAEGMFNSKWHAKKRKKLKIKVDNKIRAFGEEDDKTGQIKINVRKHKGDKAELADTIKHELIHLRSPKMHEKTVYKKTKGEMRSKEIKKFLKLLKNK